MTSAIDLEPFGSRFGTRGLAPREQTVPALLARQAAAFGDAPLVRTPDAARTFAELPEAVARRAATLAAGGVARGDRVAALCSNRIELLELILACGWLGAIAVPLNTAARGPGLEHVLRNSGARLLVSEPEFLPALATVDAAALALEDVWTLGAVDAGAPDGYRVRPMPADDGTQAPAAEVGPGDTLVILYTSGTTGPAKGVCCSHAQLYWFGLGVAELLEITPADTLYTCLPLFHVNAVSCFFQALLTGATYHLDGRFSASRFWSRIKDSGATVTYLLGAMIPILLKQPAGPHERDHRVRVANGTAPPAELDRQMRERWGFVIHECYASTETSCIVGAPLGAGRLGYMGRAMPGFDVRVVDGDDVEVPDGTPGEMVVRAEQPFALASGYFGTPERTVEAWRNLWFHTGDQVVRETGGWLRFLDRLTDSIRRRGENISSFEVEYVLLSHPDVASAAAFAVPSELGEDEVMAAVVLRDGSALDERGLVEYCVPRLAYFAIPRYIEFVPALPMTENGKVRKKELRERGVTSAAWDREAAGVELPRPGLPR